MLHRLTALAAALAVAAPLAPVPAAAQTDAEQALLQRALERGRLIYAYDQAAWHGTDDLLTKIPDPAGMVGGWIVDGPVEAPEIVFYDPAGENAVYVARFEGNRLVSSRVPGEGEDRALSPGRRAMIAARNAALEAMRASETPGCGARINTVVLPPAATGAPTLVYLLTAQMDADQIPFGGHFLIEVSADGTAGPIRRFTNSCLSMPTRAPDGGESAAMAVTHLLDPVPTEIHVFSSLVLGLPIIVSTAPNRLWAVDGSTIRLVSGN